MTQEQADQCVALAGKVYPAMSREAAYLSTMHEAFLPLRTDEVNRAIRMRASVDRFPDLPAIVAACTPPARPVAEEVARKRDALAQDAEHRYARLTTLDSLQQAYERAVASARSTPDAELMDMRDVIYGLKPHLVACYGPNADPRKLRSLALEIFEPSHAAGGQS